MQLSKTFKVPLYFSKITLKIVENVNIEAKKLYKKNKKDYGQEKEYRGLSWYFFTDNFYILLAKEDLDNGLIAHEMSHTLDDICELNGINDTESRAFLAEYIATEIYNFLKLKNIEIK